LHLNLSKSLVVCQLLLVVCSKIAKLQFWSNVFWSTIFLSYLTKGWKCSWHLIIIGYKDFLSYFLIRTTPCYLSTNEDTIWKVLILGFNI
jgi:hypothetical protein